MRQEELPKALRPFVFHGLELTQESGDQWKADCPWCDKEGHFYVHAKTGQWDCKVCGRTGNVYTFFKTYLTRCRNKTTDGDWLALAKNRGDKKGNHLPPSVYKDAGLCLNPQGEWLIPIRNTKAAIVNIRKRVMVGGKSRVYGTAGMENGLFGAHNLPTWPNAPVYIAEGEWDAIYLDWLLRECREPGVVLGIPGANTFTQDWVQLVSGRGEAYLTHDNDHAGDEGSARIGRMLHGQIRRVFYLNWPEDDAPLSKPEGYDLRDFINLLALGKGDPQRCLRRIKEMCLERHRRWNDAGFFAPDEQARLFPRGDTGPDSAVRNGVGLQQQDGGDCGDVVERVPETGAPRLSFPELIKVYKKHLRMNAAAIGALKAIFAVIVSNQISGDPVWLFIVSPAGSGKTALLMSTSEYSKVICASSITPHALVSGFRSERDPSLIPRLDGNVFVLKDFTEVLSMMPSDQESIYSTLRGAYDGRVEKIFGNGFQRVYDCHFSMIAGVTAAIHGSNRAAMGERYLRYEMIGALKSKHSKQIRRAIDQIGNETEMDKELRPAVARYLSGVKVDLSTIRNRIPAKFVKRIIAVAQVVSLLRAEVPRDWRSGDVTYRPQSEIGTRLGKQLAKFAIALSVVEGKDAVDDETYQLTEKVALDTAVGFHLNVVEAIVESGGLAGTTTADNIGKLAFIPRSTLSRVLDDLTLLGAIQKGDGTNKLGTGIRFEYSLTKRMRRLWRDAGLSLKSSTHRRVKMKPFKPATGIRADPEVNDAVRCTPIGELKKMLRVAEARNDPDDRGYIRDLKMEIRSRKKG